MMYHISLKCIEVRELGVISVISESSFNFGYGRGTWVVNLQINIDYDEA